MADLAALIREVSTAEGERRRRVEFALWEAVADAGAPNPAQPPTATAEALLSAIEAADTPLAVRLRLISWVATIGADAVVVPRLAALLDVLAVQDAVRGALERIDTDASRAVLARLLHSSAQPELRAATAAALGRIPDDAARSLLAALGDAAPAVRLAAAESLSRFPYPELDRVLAAVRTDDDPLAEVRIQRARLRLAKMLSRNGQAVMAYRVRRDVIKVAKKPWIQRDAERDLR